MKDKKDFRNEFNRIYDLLKGSNGFSFSRFSDGERTVLRNKKLVLAEKYFIQGDIHGETKIGAPQSYLQEERKEFIPEKHALFHKKLVEAYRFCKPNYLKGICSSDDDTFGTTKEGQTFEWMLELHGGDHDSLTFANTLQNGNYSLFVEKMIPEFMNHEIILVANENSKLDILPFEVKRFFPIGENCMINNYGLVQGLKRFIETENISNHLFLFSAATLSNYLCYELFKDFDNNKYMDIGSTLGPLLKLEGWKNSRSYLHSYWNDVPSPYIDQMDTWG